MGDSETVAADATVGVDAAAITATYFVNRSSLGSESAMQDSSNVQEGTISVDHQAIHGASISESMYVTTENGSISSEALINSAEEDRLWSMVRSNGSHFNSWTALIQEAERVVEGNIEKIQRVYDEFLEEFPLCYGYWKKYADHEAHFGAFDKFVEVYERAVLAVSYSVDICCTIVGSL